MTKASVRITAPVSPVDTIVRGEDGVLISTSPLGTLDISDYQSEKRLHDYQILNQNENRKKVYSLMWLQCMESMHAKIKSHRDYLSIEEALNGIDLLKMIKPICFNIEDEKYAPLKVHQAKVASYALKQERDTDQVYQTKFLNIVQVIKHCGADIGEDPLTRKAVCKVLGYCLNTMVAAQEVETSKIGKEYTLAIAFIYGSDPERYGNIVRGLENASLAGQDEWPKNVTEAYNYLSKWEGGHIGGARPRNYEGVAFRVNGEAAKPSGPQPWHAKITCRNCNKKGHIMSLCKNAKEAHTNV